MKRCVKLFSIVAVIALLLAGGGFVNGNARADGAANLNNRDVVAILRYIEGLMPKEALSPFADVNKDGVVDGRDAQYIMYAKAGLGAPEPLFTDFSLTPDKTTAAVGVEITWTAQVEGAQGTVSYKFDVLKDGVEVGEPTTYASGNTFAFTPSEGGLYTARVRVKDARGIIALADSAQSVLVGEVSFIYEKKDAGIVIKKYNGSDDEVTVPKEFDELPVIEIGDGAFEGNASLKKVVLPDAIERIGVRAFANCSNLSEMQTY